MEQAQSVVEEVLGRDSTAYGIPATTEERMGVCPARQSPAGAGGDVPARVVRGRWRRTTGLEDCF